MVEKSLRAVLLSAGSNSDVKLSEKLIRKSCKKGDLIKIEGNGWYYQFYRDVNIELMNEIRSVSAKKVLEKGSFCVLCGKLVSYKNSTPTNLATHLKNIHDHQVGPPSSSEDTSQESSIVVFIIISSIFY